MISFTAEQRFIVTGASSGIGKGVALLLNELGATVIGIGRSQAGLNSLKAECKSPENMYLEQKDLTEDIPTLPAYVKTLKEKYGKFQGLAYCAGISNVMPLKGLDCSSLNEVFAIDYFAPMMLAKGVTDKRNNNGPGSSLVFIASIAALISDVGMSAYSGAKAALVASMKSLAREVAPMGVRVNCVSPALIQTRMADEQSRAQAEGKYPMGLGRVEDVANEIVFLLSDKSSWIAGQNYVIDCASC